MAFSSGQDDPLSPSRLRNSEPLNTDDLFSFLRDAPTPTSSGRAPPQSTNSPTYNDARTNLHRRFTTNTFLSPIGQQRKQAAESSMPDISHIFQPRFSASEKKKAEYEYLRQKHQQRQDQMDQLNIENRQEQMELQRLSQELGYHGGAGHNSEPTTPPEFRDAGFPSILSRPNRFSGSSLLSSAVSSRKPTGQNSSVTSPPTERARAYNALTSGGTTASFAQQLEDSDENPMEEMDHNDHRSAANPNRFSMPALRRGTAKGHGAEVSSSGDNSRNRLLFHHDDQSLTPSRTRNSSARNSLSFFQMNENDEGFPMLLRQADNSNVNFTGPSDDMQHHQRASNRRSLPIQTSLAMSGLAKNNNNYPNLHDHHSPPLGLSGASSPGYVTPPGNQALNRHSLGSRIGAPPNMLSGSEAALAALSNDSSSGNQPHPKLQSSHSTGAIPKITSPTSGQISGFMPPEATAEQRLHQHNASLGRIPPGAIGSNRTSRDISSLAPQSEDQSQFRFAQPVLDEVVTSRPSTGSGRQTRNPFMPSLQSEGPNAASTAIPASSNVADSVTSPGSNANENSVPGLYGQKSSFAGYASQADTQHGLAAALENLNISGPSQTNHSATGYEPLPAGSPFYPFVEGGVISEQQAWEYHLTRHANERMDPSLLRNMPLQMIKGHMYSLCRDQHGCRFLQRKLDEGNPSQTTMIFEDTKDHITEMMTDPFGNYLCQKLLEQCTEEQRTVLIRNAAPQMVQIALNQHGTRALQKMIDFVSAPGQSIEVINALRDHVVTLIQDLNGNHVVQKCLNRLRGSDIQFIIDAVAMSCFVVGTHRHGCCVIQRCIDHADLAQKRQLVNAIVVNASDLVQDPFGNYVLQYVLNLPSEPEFVEAVAGSLLGQLFELSKQKFSSNVIEKKALRKAAPDMKHKYVDELFNRGEVRGLIDDNFGNYVVQTALGYSQNNDDKDLICDKLRMVLPEIRHKAYGRKLQQKLEEHERETGADRFPKAHFQQNTPLNAVAYGYGSFGSPYSHHRLGSQESSSSFQTPFAPWNNASTTGNFYGNSFFPYERNLPQGSSNDFSRPISHGSQFNGQSSQYPSLEDIQAAQAYGPMQQFPGYQNMPPGAGSGPGYF